MNLDDVYRWKLKSEQLWCPNSISLPVSDPCITSNVPFEITKGVNLTPNQSETHTSSPMIYGLDLIGLFGPFVIGFINLWQLWNNGIYWYIYIITFFVNSLINKALKIWIKEPRPMGGQSIIMSESYSGIEKYGMPSGHSQSVLYSITYSYLVKQSPMLLIGEMYIVGLTVYQRWKYRQHSLSQLSIGAIIGILVAYISYRITTKWVTEEI